MGQLKRIDEHSRSNVTYGNQPRRLVVTLGMVLRLTQSPVQVHLDDYIRVLTPDATTSAYGSLTHLMGGCVITGCEHQISNLVTELMSASAAREVHALVRYGR